MAHFLESSVDEFSCCSFNKPLPLSNLPLYSLLFIPVGLLSSKIPRPLSISSSPRRLMDHPELRQRPQAGGSLAENARRERSDSMLKKAEKILWPVIIAFLGTEEGRKLLMAEAAVQHLIVFVLSMGGFILIALVRRFDTGRLILIEACSAFLRVMMFMSLVCIFVHNKLTWISYTSCIIYSPLFFLLLLLRGQRAEGGEDGRSSSVRRERSNAMLKTAEQILLPVVAVFLATEEDRELLVSEAAAKHLIVFVLSIACLCILALICRLGFAGFVTPDSIDDCSAFFKAMVFMSLVGIFMHDELPWITYTPLLFVLLLLTIAVMRICKPNNGENIAPEMNG